MNLGKTKSPRMRRGQPADGRRLRALVKELAQSLPQHVELALDGCKLFDQPQCLLPRQRLDPSELAGLRRKISSSCRWSTDLNLIERRFDLLPS